MQCILLHTASNNSKWSVLKLAMKHKGYTIKIDWHNWTPWSRRSAVAMLLLFVKDRQTAFSSPLLLFAAFIFRSKRKAIQQVKLSSGLQSHLVSEEQGSHIYIFFHFTLSSLNVLSFHILKILSLFPRTLFVLCIIFFSFPFIFSL